MIGVFSLREVKDPPMLLVPIIFAVVAGFLLLLRNEEFLALELVLFVLRQVVSLISSLKMFVLNFFGLFRVVRAFTSK